MIIEQQFEDGINITRLNGELDASSALDLDSSIKQAIGEGKYNHLIECSKLDYIASAGLGVFMSHREQVIELNNGKIVFCHMSDGVRDVFKILGLDELFPIVSTEADARNVINHK